MIWIVVAIVLAGWLIANAIVKTSPSGVAVAQSKNDEKIRNNAREKLDKLIYQLTLKHYTCEQIVEDPTARQLLELEYYNYLETWLYSPMTINTQRKSAMYIVHNEELLDRLRELFLKGHDDRKIAEEFCRLENQREPDSISGHEKLQDIYHSHDIAKLKTDPYLKFALQRKR